MFNQVFVAGVVPQKGDIIQAAHVGVFHSIQGGAWLYRVGETLHACCETEGKIVRRVGGRGEK